MSSSLIGSASRISFVSMLLLACGCGSAVAQRPAARVSPDTVAVAANVAAPPIDGSAMPAPTAPKIDFDTLTTDLQKACPLSEDDPSNIGMKEAAAAQNECLDRAATKERDAFVASLPPNDPRIARAARIDAAFAGFVKDVCWASEEVQWVDWATGTRDDGTLRGYAWLGCESRAAQERAFYFRALRTKDAVGFARHVDDAAPRGHREAFFLKDLTTAARQLVSKPAKAKTHEMPETIAKAERSEYVKRFVAIDRTATALGDETCTAFDGLASALGAQTCAARAKTAYLALGAFEASGEDVGP